MENTKLIRTASVVDRILKILQGFAIAGVVVCAIFIPLTLIFGEKIVASADRLSLGALDLRLSGDMSGYLDLANLKLSIVVMLIGAILACAAAWYCLRVMRELLAPMKAGTPFAEGTAKKVRKLGWAVLIGGAVAELGQGLSSVFEARAYRIESLLDPSAVASVSYDYDIRLWFVVAALILFFLSLIFRHGESLQQQADETL